MKHNGATSDLRPSEPPMPDPLAFMITWSTYGTWLPGDERGWVEYRRGWQLPDPVRELEAIAAMTEDACILDDEQRTLVEKTIEDHCGIRNWDLYAVNCRTNHLHVVVGAHTAPKVIRARFKAWCARHLKELERERTRVCGKINKVASIWQNWWAERGSQRFINDERSLEAAIVYVKEGQDRDR